MLNLLLPANSQQTISKVRTTPPYGNFPTGQRINKGYNNILRLHIPNHLASLLKENLCCQNECRHYWNFFKITGLNKWTVFSVYVVNWRVSFFETMDGSFSGLKWAWQGEYNLTMFHKETCDAFKYQFKMRWLGALRSSRRLKKELKEFTLYGDSTSDDCDKRLRGLNPIEPIKSTGERVNCQSILSQLGEMQWSRSQQTAYSKLSSVKIHIKPCFYTMHYCNPTELKIYIVKLTP